MNNVARSISLPDIALNSLRRSAGICRDKRGQNLLFTALFGNQPGIEECG
jgi:hypothetical protein